MRWARNRCGARIHSAALDYHFSVVPCEFHRALPPRTASLRARYASTCHCSGFFGSLSSGSTLRCRSSAPFFSQGFSGFEGGVPSEKLVRPVVIEDFLDLGQAASTMIPALLAVLASFRSLFRSGAALQAEVFALRHLNGSGFSGDPVT